MLTDLHVSLWKKSLLHSCFLNVKLDLVKWDAIILLHHKLCKSSQIITGKAADWYRTCSSIFQQYVNIPYLISGWAIHFKIKQSHEVSGISNYSSIITEGKSFGDTISKTNGKSFSIIWVHACWHKYLHDVDGIHCQGDITPNRYSL